jgi:hypothetical protein
MFAILGSDFEIGLHSCGSYKEQATASCLRFFLSSRYLYLQQMGAVVASNGNVTIRLKEAVPRKAAAVCDCQCISQMW